MPSRTNALRKKPRKKACYRTLAQDCTQSYRVFRAFARCGTYRYRAFTVCHREPAAYRLFAQAGTYRYRALRE